jgi:hypothetical protein
MFLTGIQVLNSFDNFIPNPADDPSWSIPYHDADLEGIVEGMVYYFSAAERNQIVRDKLGNGSLDVPLSEIDLDYAKGCILSKRLLEVGIPVIATFFFNCLFLLLPPLVSRRRFTSEERSHVNLCINKCFSNAC